MKIFTDQRGVMHIDRGLGFRPTSQQPALGGCPCGGGQCPYRAAGQACPWQGGGLGVSAPKNPCPPAGYPNHTQWNGNYCCLPQACVAKPSAAGTLSSRGCASASDCTCGVGQTPQCVGGACYCLSDTVVVKGKTPGLFGPR